MCNGGRDKGMSACEGDDDAGAVPAEIVRAWKRCCCARRSEYGSGTFSDEVKEQRDREKRTETEEVVRMESARETKENNQLKQLMINDLESFGYQYISNIGRGSFSYVFRVWDAVHNCFWACKVNENCESGAREARLLQELKHPLFPKYRESRVNGEVHYLFMEDIPGRNIRELLRARGHFSQRQAVSVAFSLAQGLLYLHERSEPIVFRDIKPENVVLRQDGRVKLVDVGCACRKGEQESIAGSRGYSAPEQFDSGESIGEESDVYALGKLLFYMLTGEERVSAEELLYRKRKYRKIMSPGLLQLVVQMIQTERRCRIPDMRIIIRRLAVYEGRMSLKRFWTNVKAILGSGSTADYFYVQNVRKGINT